MIKAITRYAGYCFDILRNLAYLKLWNRIDSIQSSTAYSDLHALFLLARDGWGAGAIVEIGAYHGKSTIVMAFGSKAKNRERIVSIDPHTAESKDAFLANMKAAGIAGMVMPVILTSEEARRMFHRPARLIFIDGDHGYESVKKDILLWKDLVMDGGVMVFHDLNWESVFRALEELVLSSDEFIVEGTAGCSLMVSKRISRNRSVFEEIDLFNKMKRLLRPWKGEDREARILRDALCRIAAVKDREPGNGKHSYRDVRVPSDKRRRA